MKSVEILKMILFCVVASFVVTILMGVSEWVRGGCQVDRSVERPKRPYFVKSREVASGRYFVEVISHGNVIKSYESTETNGGVLYDGGHTFEFPDGTTTHNHNISIQIRPICGVCGKPLES